MTHPKGAGFGVEDPRARPRRSQEKRSTRGEGGADGLDRVTDRSPLAVVVAIWYNRYITAERNPPMFRISLTTEHRDPETFELLAVDHDEVLQAEALDLAAFMDTYKRCGYFVRVADGWGTAATVTEAISVCVDRLSAAEVAALEAAEAAGDAAYDAWKNA